MIWVPELGLDETLVTPMSHYFGCAGGEVSRCLARVLLECPDEQWRSRSHSILDAALHLQYGSMVQILIDRGADVNAVDQSIHRPLTYALQMDDQKWVNLVKKRGAHE